MKHKKIPAQVLISCMLPLLFSFDKIQTENFESTNFINQGPFDVIIVPGAPYRDPKSRFILKARILWAKYLYDHKVAENIIFSGASVYTPYVESKIMCLYADAMHIPTENTIAETHAEHSTENIYYSLLIARNRGFKRIAVATDQYQSVVLKRFMKKICPDVKIIPIDYSKIDLMNAAWPDIDASSAFVEDFISLTDRTNSIERLKGSLGRKINYSDQDSVSVKMQTPFLTQLDKFLSASERYSKAFKHLEIKNLLDIHIMNEVIE